MINKKRMIAFMLSIVLILPNLSFIETVAAENETEISQEVLEENFELPEIYENTLIYNGTINPQLSIELLYPEDEVGELGPDNAEEIFVNEAGHFSLVLDSDQLAVGEEITMLIWEEGTRDPSIEDIEILPEEEGMEIVESTADTSNVQNAVLEATEFEWHDGGSSISLDIETVGDLEGTPFVSLNDSPISDESRIEHIDGSLFRAHYQPDTLEVGDVVTAYIVASGVTTSLEIEVPDTLESLAQDESVETEEEPDEMDNDDESSETEEDMDTDNEPEEDEVEDTGEQEEETEEVESPEVENTDQETENGLSIAWLIIGGIVVLAIIGGVIYAFRKRNNHVENE